jgi:hypothetical protein
MVFGQSNEIIWEGQVKSGEIPGTRNYWTSDSSRYIRCDGGVCCFVNSYWDEYFRYLGWVDLDDKFYIVCNGKFLEDSNGVKNVWIKEAYLLNNSVPYVTLFNLETEMLSAYLWEHKIGELYYPPLTKALEMYPNNWYERIIYADGTTTYRVVNIPLADNSGAGLTNNFLQSLVGAFVKFNGELYYARWRDHIIHLASDDENNVYGITSFLDVYEANHTPAAEAPIGTLPRYRFFVRNGFGTFRRKYSGAEGQEWGVPENPVLMPDFFSQAESLNSSILHGGGNEFTKKFCTPETFTYQLVRGTHGDDPEEENYINDASFPGDYVELASDPGGFAVYQEKTFKCITRKMAFEIDPDEPPYKTSRITSCSGGGVAPLNMGMDRCACYADVEWAIVAFKHVCSTYPAFFIIKNGEYVDNWTGVGALPLIYRKEASYIDICNGGTGGTTATLFATGEYTRNYFSPITAWSYSEHCFRFFLVTGQGIISELYGEPVPPDLPVRLRTRYLYTNCPVNPGAMLCCGNNSEVTYFYKGANNEYIWGEGTGNVKSCDVYIRGKFVANVAPIHNAICCDRFIVVQDVSDSTLWSVWTYSDEPKHWDFNFTQTPSITHCCNGIMKLQAQTTEGLRCIFFGYEGVFAESDANDCNDYTILCCGTKRAIAVNANISFVVDDTFGLIPIDMYNLKVLDNVHETDFLNYNETRIKKLTMEDIETNE